MAKLVVITGPSGVGKGTLIKRLLSSVDGLHMSVSATTRQPRDGELDGREYHFLTREQFGLRLEAGDFLESAEYAGNLYGTLVDEVIERGDEAKGVVLEIEVQGAEQVKAKIADAVLIFIAPPDRKSLESRLRDRATDTDEQIALRLAQADVEIEAVERFDTVIVNDDLESASAQLITEVAGRLD
jgi:guanylate kinase